jgi:hypothetical protein
MRISQRLFIILWINFCNIFTYKYIYNFINIKCIYKILNWIMNSLWDIRIFLGLVPKESPCISQSPNAMNSDIYTLSSYCTCFYTNINHVMLLSEMITAFTVISKGTWEICIMKTNLMHYLSSVYFVNQPLHVSYIFLAHHLEVYYIYIYIYIYTVIGTFFHTNTVHLDIIRFFCYSHQLMHNWIVLKTILKFTLKLTLKQLLHVSVQSPSSGSALFELAKVTVVKIVN